LDYYNHLSTENSFIPEFYTKNRGIKNNEKLDFIIGIEFIRTINKAKSGCFHEGIP